MKHIILSISLLFISCVNTNTNQIPETQTEEIKNDLEVNLNAGVTHQVNKFTSEQEFLKNPTKLQFERKSFKGNDRVTDFYKTLLINKYIIKIWNSKYSNQNVKSIFKVIHKGTNKTSLLLTRNQIGERTDLSVKTKFTGIKVSNGKVKNSQSYHDGDSSIFIISFKETKILILYINDQPKACFEINNSNEITPPSKRALELLKQSAI